jgi:hypothetical protein
VRVFLSARAQVGSVSQLLRLKRCGNPGCRCRTKRYLVGMLESHAVGEEIVQDSLGQKPRNVYDHDPLLALAHQPHSDDNETTWLDWNLLEQNRDIFRFFKGMIAF